jgi:hypothetical protein
MCPSCYNQNRLGILCILLLLLLCLSFYYRAFIGLMWITNLTTSCSAPLFNKTGFESSVCAKLWQWAVIYMCARVSILPHSMISLFYFGTVPTVCVYLFFIISQYRLRKKRKEEMHEWIRKIQFNRNKQRHNRIITLCWSFLDNMKSIFHSKLITLCWSWKIKTQMGSLFSKRFDWFKCSSEPTLQFDWLSVLYILRIRRTATEQVYRAAKLKVGLKIGVKVNCM